MVGPREGSEDGNQEKRPAKRGRGMFTAIRDLDDAATLTADGRKLDLAFLPRTGHFHEHDDRDGMGHKRRRHFRQHGGGESRHGGRLYNLSPGRMEMPEPHGLRGSRTGAYSSSNSERWNPDDGDRSIFAPKKEVRDGEKRDQWEGHKKSRERSPDALVERYDRVEKLSSKDEVLNTSGGLQKVKRQRSPSERNGRHGSNQGGERNARNPSGECREGAKCGRDEDGAASKEDERDRRLKSTFLTGDPFEGRDRYAKVGRDDTRGVYKSTEGRDRDWRSLDGQYGGQDGRVRNGGQQKSREMESRHGRWQTGPQVRRSDSSYQQPPKRVEKWGHDLFEQVAKEDTTKSPEEDELKARITALLSS